MSFLDNFFAVSSQMVTYLAKLAGTVDGSDRIAVDIGGVTLSGDLSAVVTNVTSSGTLALVNDAVTVAMDGRPFAGFAVGAGFTGTIAFEASRDGGTTYKSVQTYSSNTVPATIAGATLALTGTGDDRGILVPLGATHVRARVSAASSGTCTAAIRASVTGVVQYPQLDTIVTALGSYLATLAGSVSAGRVAIDVSTTIATYLSNLPTLVTALGAAAAQDRTTAASPSSTRLSTGAAFYDATKTGQLPTNIGQTTKSASLSIAHASDDLAISDVTTSATLGALAAVVQSATANKASAGFMLLGGGTLVGTLVPECLIGNWEPTNFLDPLTGAVTTSLAVSSPGSDTIRGIQLLPGATQVRVRVSVYTSGSGTGITSASNAAPQLGKLETINTSLGTLHTDVGAPSAIYGGKTVVTTAGTRVALGSSQALTAGVLLRGLDANTGLIYPGNGSVSATASGTRIMAREPVWIACNNVNLVSIDAAVNGEGVTWIGW